MSLSDEIQKLRQETRAQAKEIARLKEENEFLADESAFFAASRRSHKFFLTLARSGIIMQLRLKTVGS